MIGRVDVQLVILLFHRPFTSLKKYDHRAQVGFTRIVSGDK